MTKGHLSSSIYADSMPIPELQFILLIDDNPNDRLLVRRQLDKAFNGLSVREICNQEQLDRAIAEDHYEFVITDYQLGWTTGIDVLKAVKKIRPECPVIMFTNTGTEEIAVAAMKLGLDDYVIKTPRHFTRLIQAVSTIWHQFQTELRAAELDGRLQALLTQLEVGIFRANPSGELLDANQALFEMLRVDSIAAAQSVWSSQLSDQVAMSMAEKIETAKALTKEIEITVNQPSADAASNRTSRSKPSTRWLKISATLNIFTRTPVIDGLVEDITARKQAQKALLKVNTVLEKRVKIRTEQLESSNRELESFAYSVSHDLRTPIRQISSLVGLMQERFRHILNRAAEDDRENPTADATERQPDETTQHYLETISRLAVRAEEMIRSLLNLSRVGRATMVIVPVDMAKLVEQEIAQITSAGEDESDHPPDLSAPERHRRSVSFSVQPMPTVECDHTLIQAVWQNLIDNALKFTQNQPNPKITIGTKSLAKAETTKSISAENISAENASGAPISNGSEEIIFFIQDNGIGFDPTQAEKIFGVFQQAHSDEQFAGSGIGLANVKRIIGRHEGRVWAQSEPNEGATFYFSLPKMYRGEDSYEGKVTIK